MVSALIFVTSILVAAQTIAAGPLIGHNEFTGDNPVKCVLKIGAAGVPVTSDDIANYIESNNNYHKTDGNKDYYGSYTSTVFHPQASSIYLDWVLTKGPPTGHDTVAVKKIYTDYGVRKSLTVLRYD